MMNVERMEKLAEFLEGLDRQKFDMTWWSRVPFPAYSTPTETNPSGVVRELGHSSGADRMKEPECGTTGCIAGWASHLAMNDSQFDVEMIEDPTARVPRSIPVVAKAWLGLTQEQADNLFACVAHSQKATMKDVAQVVRLMISGENRPWGPVLKQYGVTDDV